MSLSPDDWDPLDGAHEADAETATSSVPVSTNDPVDGLQAKAPPAVLTKADASADPTAEANAGFLSRALPGEVPTPPMASPEPRVSGTLAVGRAGSDSPADVHNESVPRRRFTLHSLVELVHDLAIAVIVCILLITYVVQAFKVQGSSMSPTLVNGERILVNKFVYNFNFSPIDRGDIVVFWYPEDPNLSFIKRVVGLPGEIIEIRSGEVYIDGEAYPELYIAEDKRDSRNLTPREVRPGHYFVLGDNRVGSNDSRSWGFVPKRYIYGQAFLRLWPLGSFGLVE